MSHLSFSNWSKKYGPCNCQSRTDKHKIYKNCLSCGLIICEGEKCKNCPFCNNDLDENSSSSSPCNFSNFSNNSFGETSNRLEYIQRDKLIRADLEGSKKSQILIDQAEEEEGLDLFINKEAREKILKAKRELSKFSEFITDEMNFSNQLD